MKKGIGYYVMTSGGVVVKLGHIVTSMNITLRSVRDELGRGLGIGGWNYVESGGIGFWVEGPGIVKEDIVSFVVDRDRKVMSLELSGVSVSGEVPRIVGYSYEVPVGLGNVIEYEVNDEEVFNVDSDIVYDYKSLNKLKKSELLGMLGDVDANLDGRLTKSEVIEYIIKLNKKD